MESESNGIIYRRLEGEEAKAAAPIFQQFGSALPEECVLSAAISGQRIVGFFYVDGGDGM